MVFGSVRTSGELEVEDKVAVSWALGTLVPEALKLYILGVVKF